VCRQGSVEKRKEEADANALVSLVEMCWRFATLERDLEQAKRDGEVHGSLGYCACSLDEQVVPFLNAGKLAIASPQSHRRHDGVPQPALLRLVLEQGLALEAVSLTTSV
jgi:hypothetical protein